VKKGKVVAVVLVVLLVLALILGGVWLMLQKDREAKAVEAAEAAQAEAYAAYQALMQQITESTLTVTEQGKQIGVYDLGQLGLLDQARADAEQQFGIWDRMPPEQFAALTSEEKTTWQQNAVRQTPAVTLHTAQLDCGPVLLDLAKELRKAPKDAYAYFENGSYQIAPETAGTQLDMAAVEQALKQSFIGAAPGQLTFEVADAGAYLPAAVNAETGVFDYASLLQHDAEGVTITVELLEGSETLQVAPLVQVDDQGLVQADRAALEQIVAGWAQASRRENKPYILDSFVEGPIELDFLLCDYELDQTLLVTMLEALVCQLEETTVEAPFFCVRNGEPFAIGDTYVEVDIDNQHMTYYVDGNVLVDTDVVTGYPWGHWTPPGLYAVQNIDVECWLSGPDYNVFVDYWVGFHGAYGIHDASWRTIFGGKKYLTDGSHGCVNTPTEAMRVIHANIEVGTPVVVHDEMEPDDY